MMGDRLWNLASAIQLFPDDTDWSAVVRIVSGSLLNNFADVDAPGRVDWSFLEILSTKDVHLTFMYTGDVITPSLWQLA